MASFLSFVYRRQSSAPASFQTSNDVRDRPFENYMPPDITSSGSSETGWDIHDLNDTEDALEFKQRAPITPEGLLPRKTANSLRRELMSQGLIDPVVLSRREKELSGVTKVLAVSNNRNHLMMATSNQESYCGFGEDEDDDDNIMILPPPGVCHLETKATFESCTVLSPPISTSSFYTKTSDRSRPVAMSPVLQVGKARTAVGALVALREAANHRNNQNNQDLSIVSNGDKARRIICECLPPLDKTHKEHDNSFSMSVLPPQTDIRKGKITDCEDDLSVNDTYGENVPFQYHHSSHKIASDTPMQNQRSRSNSDGQCYASPSSMEKVVPFSALREWVSQPSEQSPTLAPTAVILNPPGTTEKIHNKPTQTLMGSPHPTPYYYDPDCLSLGSKSQKSSKSLISLGRLEEEVITPSQPHHYVVSEEDFDEELICRKRQNQEQRKKLALTAGVQDGNGDSSFKIFEEGTSHDRSLGIEDENSVILRDTFQADLDTKEAENTDFAEVLRRRKLRNQREEKESLLLEVVARLRDNIDLVSDVEAAASNSLVAMGSWFVPMKNGGNLLTGFSSKQRSQILCNLDNILQEMDMAQPEEFILSPSKVPLIAIKHDLLWQALSFCRALVLSAVPVAEKEELLLDLQTKRPGCNKNLFIWKSLPGLRLALGLEQPQSPVTVRGGGTSVFSLPEESGSDTPHTSNVSVGSTITSLNTFTTTQQRQDNNIELRLILQQDGLQLRQTIQFLSSSLQSLSAAASQLSPALGSKQAGSAAQTYVRSCDQIKQAYLQLVSIQKKDFQCLMSAFFLETVNSIKIQELSATYDVSADKDGDTPARQMDQKLRILALTSALVDQNSGGTNQSKTTAHNSPSRNSRLPNTEDMRSMIDKDDVEDAPYELDDLRRQTGSCDRDDCEDREERDVPFEDAPDSNEWRQMYQNVSLAASSMRSQAVPSKNNALR